MARKANPLIAPLPSTCDFCDKKVVWRNDKLSLCGDHYAEKISPQIEAGPVGIAVQKRMREVNDWVGKHLEFKTKRDACLHILKKRGLYHLLPDSLK